MPLNLHGWRSLPFAQLIAWPILAWLAKRRAPERTWRQALGIGALSLPAVLGSEWGHNLAHAAVAQWIGKPVDSISILAGMPRLQYKDVNDQSVSPRQHQLRALGGPLFNLLLLPLLWLLRQFSLPKTAAREVLDAAFATNWFIPLVGLLPITYLDGGPLLKWELVERGSTPAQADQQLRKVNGWLALGLGVASFFLFRRRKWAMGGFALSMAGSALGIALGWIKED